MATEDDLFQCYNKGCGKSFRADENGSDACVHHPGTPVFHDALKGWSCCKKRTTDFTEFLNIPGCSKSEHNPVKPVEEPKPQARSKDEMGIENASAPPPPRQPIQPVAPEERPSADETMIHLPVTVDAALKSALEKLAINSENQKDQTSETKEVKIGTHCKNKGCHETFQGESSMKDRCRHHPGAAIFHEGMKYWSCCNRKTSDFNSFLSQEGCAVGCHVFQSGEDEEKKLVSCRHDWHQTGKVVVLSVYCKKADPDTTTVKANQVSLDIRIIFDQGKSAFQKKISLEGVVHPEKSVVNMLSSKVEIKLHKAEPLSWKKFEI